MFIQTEATPNPATLKFIPGGVVMAGGRTADFRRDGDVSASPLATRLLRVGGVTGVFLGADFIAVTAEPDLSWDILKPLVLTAMLDHHLSGAPFYTAPAPINEPARATDPLNDAIVGQIIELIETRVRPAVAGDGGDIEFSHFEDGIVYVHMRGACAGCPSSTATLKSGIENMLKHYIPEVTEIRAVDDMVAA